MERGIRIEVHRGSWRFRAFGPAQALTLRVGDDALADMLRALAVDDPLGPIIETLTRGGFNPLPREGGGWWLSRAEAAAVTGAVPALGTVLLPVVAKAFDQAEGDLAEWIRQLRLRFGP